MEKFANFIVRKRWWVLATWVIATVLIVGLAPKLSSIESNDQSSFLPSTYESVQAAKIAEKISKTSDAPTDIILIQNKTKTALTEDQLKQVQSITLQLNQKQIKKVSAVVTSEQQISPDKTAQLVTVIYKGNGDDTETINAVKDVRNALTSVTKGTDLTAGLTGGEAIGYDTQDSANRALAIVSIGTLLLVFFLPALIFRSPLAGLFPIVAVGLVFTLSSSLIALAGHVFDFHVSQQLSILFTVVLYGIGTDYILFLLFRYR